MSPGRGISGRTELGLDNGQKPRQAWVFWRRFSAHLGDKTGTDWIGLTADSGVLCLWNSAVGQDCLGISRMFASWLPPACPRRASILLPKISCCTCAINYHVIAMCVHMITTCKTGPRLISFLELPRCFRLFFASAMYGLSSLFLLSALFLNLWLSYAVRINLQWCK